jgi:uncharacterized tellurite resistance protein B-like protein
MGDNHSGARFEGAQLIVGGEEGDSTVYDAKFLISILLVYVSKGDGQIDSVETDRMIDIITKRFDSSSAEAMGLLSDAVKSLTGADDLIEKLKEISQGLSNIECSEIFATLLEVIMADGKLHEGEVRTVEAAGKILGLSQDAIHTGIRAVR